MIRVTIWNEYIHEKNDEQVAALYPNGMHDAISKGINGENFVIRTATLEEPEHGLSDEVLANTDVLIWWGHSAHDQVSDEVVNKVYNHIHLGMGFIALHAAHHSKVFKKLMGTTCSLNWRVSDDKERFWIVQPNHPITQGLDAYFELPQEEMYGEWFDIPEPDELIFISWFSGGEVFRSGCTFRRGKGKIFYFRPGHETFPTYYDPNVLKVISNGVHWSAPLTHTSSYLHHIGPAPMIN